LVRLGGYDATLNACGDLDILCRLTQHGGAGVLVPLLLQGYYCNPDGLSQATSQSTTEQNVIFSRARADTPIEILYEVDPRRVGSIAEAWTDLGNLAYEVRVPWGIGPLGDSDFALECYERALAIDSAFRPALHNRYVVLFRAGRFDEAETSLTSINSIEAATVRGMGLGLVDCAAKPRRVGAIYCDGKTLPDRG
jgi:hypothetical protein